MQTFILSSLLQKKFIGTDDLRRQLTTILDKLPNEKGVVITQHGKPQAVLLDVASYIELEEELQEQIADMNPKLIKRVNAALADSKKNGGIPAEKVFKDLDI